MRIISGAQTGVDRAVLDFAMEHNIPCGGGWCPKGRRALDGVIPERYVLKETSTRDYAQRTELNVRDAEWTLVLHRGKMGRGTQLTIRLATAVHKLLDVVDIRQPYADMNLAATFVDHEQDVINFAGPSEDTDPGVYDATVRFLGLVF